MRLWHKELIHYLPDRQLCSQHRECCALRGLGWGRKHSVVDYVFFHPYTKLYYYHRKVMEEMTCRGYSVDSNWLNQHYRGKKLGTSKSSFTLCMEYDDGRVSLDYSEHNNKYLKECLLNLKSKNVTMKNGYSIEKRLIELDLIGDWT